MEIPLSPKQTWTSYLKPQTNKHQLITHTKGLLAKQTFRSVYQLDLEEVVYKVCLVPLVVWG